MPNKVLETKNLNAYYGDFQALFEVSIDLFEGEIIAIIGANGAGKSTFMRSVTGLIDRIDNDINYFTKYRKFLGIDKNQIIELKASFKKDLNELMKDFPFPRSRFSKYTNGVEKLLEH